MKQKSNNVIGGTQASRPLHLLLEKCGVVEIMDVFKNHEFALAMTHGTWRLVSMPGFSNSHDP